MAAGTAVGSALAAIASVGATIGKVAVGVGKAVLPVLKVAGKAVVTGAKTVFPKVAEAAVAGTKTFGGQLLKEAGQLALATAKVAIPAGMQFAQIRAARTQQEDTRGRIDDVMAQTKAIIQRDPFANVTYSTRGLEEGLKGAMNIAGDVLQRQAEGSQRGVYGGGRALQGVQDYMQKVATTYGDRRATIDLARARGASERDVQIAGLNLNQIAGLQAFLADQRGAEMGGFNALAKLLPGLADLFKNQPFSNELNPVAEEVDTLEENIVEEIGYDEENPPAPTKKRGSV